MQGWEPVEKRLQGEVAKRPLPRAHAAPTASLAVLSCFPWEKENICALSSQPTEGRRGFSPIPISIMLWPRCPVSCPWTPHLQPRLKSELRLNYCFVECIKTGILEINFLSCLTSTVHLIRLIPFLPGFHKATCKVPMKVINEPLAYSRWAFSLVVKLSLKMFTPPFWLAGTDSQLWLLASAS